MNRRLLASLPLVAALALGACSSEGGDDATVGTTTGGPDVDATTTTAAPGSTTTTAPAEPFTILVSDDDGVAAPGIDALVQGLLTLDDVHVVVVAPADQQSGTGGQTSPAPPAVTQTTTASGYEATAVAGFPADAVTYALDTVFAGTQPDLVVTGINFGQNIGPAVDLSGTIGAARVAAARGIPALAASQGLADQPDYAAGVEEVLAWIAEHRDSLEPGTVANLNIPTCTTGERKDVVEVEPDLGGDLGRALGASDCTAPAGAAPSLDVDAFLQGYVTLTDDVGPAAG